MRKIILSVLVLAVSVLVAAVALAGHAVVNVAAADVVTSDTQLVIAVALPAGGIGRRVDRAVLEVPIALGESANSLFNTFPLLELYESGSELPKQTTLLAKSFNGVARFDVTRFVRTWSTTDARQFVLGAVSEANGTAFELTTASAWAGGVKARLVIAYSNRDGQGVAADAE